MINTLLGLVSGLGGETLSYSSVWRISRSFHGIITHNSRVEPGDSTGENRNYNHLFQLSLASYLSKSVRQVSKKFNRNLTDVCEALICKWIVGYTVQRFCVINNNTFSIISFKLDRLYAQCSFLPPCSCKMLINEQKSVII